MGQGNAWQSPVLGRPQAGGTRAASMPQWENSPSALGADHVRGQRGEHTCSCAGVARSGDNAVAAVLSWHVEDLVDGGKATPNTPGLVFCSVEPFSQPLEHERRALRGGEIRW